MWTTACVRLCRLYIRNPIFYFLIEVSGGKSSETQDSPSGSHLEGLVNDCFCAIFAHNCTCYWLTWMYNVRCRMDVYIREKHGKVGGGGNATALRTIAENLLSARRRYTCRPKSYCFLLRQETRNYSSVFSVRTGLLRDKSLCDKMFKHAIQGETLVWYKDFRWTTW